MCTCTNITLSLPTSTSHRKLKVVRVRVHTACKMYTCILLQIVEAMHIATKVEPLYIQTPCGPQLHVFIREVSLIQKLNPRHMHSEVCQSICPRFVRPLIHLSVTTFSATMRNKTAKKRYQWVQCHTGLIFKMAICILVLRSKVIA